MEVEFGNYPLVLYFIIFSCQHHVDFSCNAICIFHISANVNDSLSVLGSIKPPVWVRLTFFFFLFWWQRLYWYERLGLFKCPVKTRRLCKLKRKRNFDDTFSLQTLKSLLRLSVVLVCLLFQQAPSPNKHPPKDFVFK